MKEFASVYGLFGAACIIASTLAPPKRFLGLNEGSRAFTWLIFAFGLGPYILYVMKYPITWIAFAIGFVGIVVCFLLIRNAERAYDLRPAIRASFRKKDRDERGRR